MVDLLQQRLYCHTGGLLASVILPGPQLQHAELQLCDRQPATDGSLRNLTVQSQPLSLSGVEGRSLRRAHLFAANPQAQQSQLVV